MKALLLILLLTPHAAPARAMDGIDPSQNITPDTPEGGEIIVSPEQKRRRMTEPLQEYPPKFEKQRTMLERTVVDRVLDRAVVKTERGPLILLPVVDRSKDLGFSMGVMPIMAVRTRGGDKIHSVVAPSFTYNKHFGGFGAYRHYFFPDDKQLWVLRASLAANVQRELFLRYFNPHILGTDWGLNAELRHWRNGKAAFYGFGPTSPAGNEAGFTLNLTGEEFTLNLPVWKDFFIEFHHSFYGYNVESSPNGQRAQLVQIFPAVAEQVSTQKNIVAHRASLKWDSTDHPALPRRGTMVQASGLISRSSLASSFSYETWAATVKHYVNIDDGRWVTALFGHIQHQTGEDLPFYAQSTVGEFTGQRVVGDGRYVDRGKVLFTVEQRTRISQMPLLKFLSEMEITPFLDWTTVFNKRGEIRADQFHTGYGVAFRIVLRPQVVVNTDLVFGREGPNFLIHVGYPF